MTNQLEDGPMAGEFRVVVHQSTEREPTQTSDGGRVGRAISVVPAADCLPAIYSDSTTSPLTATVEPKANEVNLEL